jgi:Uncharacterised protein family (UPF0236)
LQRVLTDFGGDKAFGKVPKKLKEHYGIEVPVSMARQITEMHGEAMRLRAEEEMTRQVPTKGKQGVELLIAEMDGSMLPIVEITPQTEGAPADGRKRRQLGWTEARLCLARDPGKVKGHYGGTLGGPEQAGDHLVNCVVEAGGGKSTKLHGLGDGAPWIVGQVRERFGPLANYLIDFCHMSQYLTAAGEAIAGKPQSEWLHQQKERMKQSQVAEVLDELEDYVSPAQPEGPVPACIRYLRNRIDSFDYKSALDVGLPIGSGEVESGHGWIFQDRLKISGAWWKRENLASMMALRLVSANNQWESYWQSVRQAAA